MFFGRCGVGGVGAQVVRGYARLGEIVHRGAFDAAPEFGTNKPILPFKSLSWHTATADPAEGRGAALVATGPAVNSEE
jgi:hypothetical protein